MLSDRWLCPVCLSVTLVYCGQKVSWIKLPLGTEVGIGPGHTVLDGDPFHSTERGTAAPFFQRLQTHASLRRINRGPCLLWPNGRPSQQLLSSCSTKRKKNRI